MTSGTTIKPLPITPALLAVARRVVWFQEPEETLDDPVHFLAHVMTYGTVDDLAALKNVIRPEDYSTALRQAPPGIFDARSWAYWHLRYGEQPAPPLPSRHLAAPDLRRVGSVFPRIDRIRGRWPRR